MSVGRVRGDAHTRGPWRLTYEHGGRSEIIATGFGTFRREVEAPHEAEGSGNAHLIVAAPDLYEALSNLMTQVALDAARIKRLPTEVADALDAAAKALNKADGR